MPTIKTEDFTTSRDAAIELDLDSETISAYCRRGVLRGIKIGSVWLIKKTEIIRYQRDRKNVGRPKKKSPTTY